MSLESYSALKAEIASHLARDNLSTEIDTFIDIAEARFKEAPEAGGVRIRDMIARQTSAMDARYEVLPFRYLGMIEFRLLTDPVTVLEEVSPHEITRLRQNTTGKPTRFAVHGTEIEFDRAPDSSYTGEMIFWQALEPLTDSNSTNALLTNAPHCYLYGALAASAAFLMADERVQLWESLYARAQKGVNGLGRKRSGPLIPRIQGAAP